MRRSSLFLSVVLLQPDLMLMADVPEDMLRMYRPTAATARSNIVIHEWGTFTSLQNENGDAIGGINVDTELLPVFVHNFAPHILPTAVRAGQKGLPTPRPRLDVTMRLETPIVYFHLPPDSPRPMTLDLTVRFRGGWLTQFYPDADADIDGRAVSRQPLSPIPYLGSDAESARLASVGGLAWCGLTVGTEAAVPVTNSRVWLAPRDVQCDRVTTAKGETEQYLFYRGVGHLDAPLRVSHADGGEDGRLHIRSQVQAMKGSSIRRLWLVNVAGGRLAFRSVGPLVLSEPAGHLEVRSGFEGSDFTAAALSALQDDLRGALVEDGLFRDEADALLKTWEHSYFRDEGLRLFFLVPQAWTDAHLPLRVSVASDIRRSMVGRIEIITPRQRVTLSELAAIQPDLPNKEYFQQAGAACRQLGRFAAALILEEHRVRPSDALATYIRRARIEPFAVTPVANPTALSQLGSK